MKLVLLHRGELLEGSSPETVAGCCKMRRFVSSHVTYIKNVQQMLRVARLRHASIHILHVYIYTCIIIDLYKYTHTFAYLL